MEIRLLCLGDYQTNCYLVSDDKGATAVIDPGYAPERILAAAREAGLTIRAILLTHGHFDHVGAVRALADTVRCPVWMHEKELSLPKYLTAGELYYTDDYVEGAQVQVGDLTFTVLETPGHTSGSVCLKCGTALFTGDTLFTGSCGRTDLGGSWAQMMQSLRRLSRLEGHLTVLPGHGPASVLSYEVQNNGAMQEAMG